MLSRFGSTFYATVLGVGINDDLTLTKDGRDICLKSEVVEFQVLSCDLDPGLTFLWTNGVASELALKAG